MPGLIIAKHFELTQAQAQALVDLEAQCADLGLLMWILCQRCKQIGDDGHCDGSHDTHDDGSLTFTVKCRCSIRAFRGSLRAPLPPRELRKPRLDLALKVEQALTRPQMTIFQDAADALYQLRLAYAMRCLACRQEDRLTDGVWGSAESNASQFVVECACTKRMYRGADVKLVS